MFLLAGIGVRTGMWTNKCQQEFGSNNIAVWSVHTDDWFLLLKRLSTAGGRVEKRLVL